MTICLLKSKIHRATVTGASVDYEGSLTIASDLCARRVVTIFADEPLSLALTRLDEHGFRQLPVVARENPRRVIGMLERQHILAAYRRSLARRSEEGASDGSGAGA